MKNKIGILSIISAALLGTITTMLVTYVNIYTFPGSELIHKNEIILLFLMIILYLFGRKFKIRSFNIITIIGISLGIINLVGFYVIVNFLMGG